MAVATAPSKENLRQGPHRVEVEPTPRRVRVVFNGQTIADSKRAVLLRESNSSPVYYSPARGRARRIPRAHRPAHALPI